MDPASTSPSPATCQRCGARLSSSGLGGVCPRCLFTDALPSESGSTPPPDSTPGSDSHRAIKPTPVLLRYFGDYELEGEIARGGMGVIHRARQLSLGRLVAIKLMSAGEFARPEVVQRFRTEAMAAAKLQHPNIVAIHEVGEHAGLQYFSMDLVEGPNLAAQLAGQPLPARRAAQLLKILADAVQYAHDRGILHRDLKPSNVLIDPFGAPRITDFGLAKDIAADSDLTVTGQVLGTPGYLPPEQADPSRGPLGPAGDVYSLGAILYFTLTGRPPFVGGSIHETIRQVLNDDPVAPRLLNSGVPRDLETICLKCLEREPTRRYPTASELAADLKRFLDGLPIHARPISQLGRFTRWCRRRPALAAVWVLVATLAVGSTVAAAVIQAGRSRTQAALTKATAAENTARDRLREARLSEARAISHTTQPGRRTRALAALEEATRIRAGPDLRDEALSCLLLNDIRPIGQFNLNPGVPSVVRLDSRGVTAVMDFPHPSGYHSGHATVWRWGNTQSVATIDIPVPALGQFQFSPDGNAFLNRYEDDTVRIWRVGETKPYLELRNRRAPDVRSHDESFVDDTSFSPDGRFVVSGIGGTNLTLHRSSDGAEVARGGDGKRFNQVRFSPDGRWIAAARYSDLQEREFRIFSATDLKLVRTVPIPSNPGWLCWSSDSQLIALTLGDGTVGIYDARTGKSVVRMATPSSGVGDITFLGGDTMLGVRGRGTSLRILGVVAGSDELVLEGYSRAPLSALPDGRSFLSTSVLGVITRWEVQTPTGYRILPPGGASGYAMDFNNCCIDFTPDGRWLLSSHGRFTVLRDVETGRVLDELDTGIQERDDYATIMLLSDGRSFLRCSTVTGLTRHKITETPDGLRLSKGEIVDRESGFYIMDHTADGKRMVLVSLSQEGREEVRILDASPTTVTPVTRWKAPDAYGAALSADGQELLLNAARTGTNGINARIQIHRVSDGGLIRKLTAPISCDASWGKGVALTSNGQSTSVLWDAKRWEPIATLQGELGGDVTTFCVAPDDSFAVICQERRLFFLSTQTGQVIASFECPSAPSNAAGIRFLPDGRQFALLWRDGRVDLCNLEALRKAAVEHGLGW